MFEFEPKAVQSWCSKLSSLCVPNWVSCPCEVLWFTSVLLNVAAKDPAWKLQVPVAENSEVKAATLALCRDALCLPTFGEGLITLTLPITRVCGRKVSEGSLGMQAWETLVESILSAKPRDIDHAKTNMAVNVLLIWSADIWCVY